MLRAFRLGHPVLPLRADKRTVWSQGMGHLSGVRLTQLEVVGDVVTGTCPTTFSCSRPRHPSSEQQMHVHVYCLLCTCYRGVCAHMAYPGCEPLTTKSPRRWMAYTGYQSHYAVINYVWNADLFVQIARLMWIDCAVIAVIKARRCSLCSNARWIALHKRLTYDLSILIQCTCCLCSS